MWPHWPISYTICSIRLWVWIGEACYRHSAAPNSTGSFALSQETETFLKHLQIEKTPSVHQAFKGNEQYLWLPSVVMLLIAGRCFIFWCLNVIFFNCVAINGRVISTNAEKMKRAHTATSQYNGSAFSEVSSVHFIFLSETCISAYDHFQNRFDRSFSPSSGMTGSMKRMPYPSYPSNVSTSQRPWSPMSHSTSYEYNNNRQSTLPKRDVSRNVSPVKLISTTSTPANLLIADLTNPWREVDTVDAAPNRAARPQQFELLEKPSKLKMLSDAVYKFDDTKSRSTFYPERDLAGRVPWSYKRSRSGDEIAKQKVKFEDFDHDEVLPSIMAPNYQLHFAIDDREHQQRQQPLHANGVAARNAPTKQFVNTANHRVSDSDGRE